MCRSVERSLILLCGAWGRAILFGESQFLRELHFIEASVGRQSLSAVLGSQFLRELHFIEALTPTHYI